MPQAIGDLPRLGIEIALSGDFARQSFRLIEAGEGFIIAPQPVENPALLEKSIGVRTSPGRNVIFVATWIGLKLGKGRRKLAFARKQRRPSDPQPRIIGANLCGSVQLCLGRSEIAVDFLELAPPKQCLENVGCRLNGFVVELARLCDPSLALEVPGQVGQ